MRSFLQVGFCLVALSGCASGAGAASPSAKKVEAYPRVFIRPLGSDSLEFATSAPAWGDADSSWGIACRDLAVKRVQERTSHGCLLRRTSCVCPGRSYQNVHLDDPGTVVIECMPIPLVAPSEPSSLPKEDFFPAPLETEAR